VKALLIGKNGQLGHEFARSLPALIEEVVATDRVQLELTDLDAVRRIVRDVRPNVIINASAYNAVDRAEDESKLAMTVNGVAPGVLAEEARRLGALLVHYSTDYVFDGSKRSPYVEDDVPAPLGAYGASKLAGERAVQASGSRYLLLRTSWVYGPRANNFYAVVKRKAAAGEPMRMVDDQTSVPTPARFLAATTIALLKKDCAGLMHLVPSGAATRYDFARAIVRLSGSRAEVESARTTDFPSAARRPAYSVMSNARAGAALGRALPDWEAQLEEVMACPAG
jgi:dTDP-4-dehydrorhamnose reductase